MLTPHQQRARRHTVAASAINTFALDLYSKLASRHGNLFFSPFSVYEALGLAFAGAAAQTADQMSRVLRWGIDQRDTPPTAHLGIGDDVTTHLVLANAAWAQRGFPFLQTYVNRIVGPYHAAFFEADFAHAAEPTRRAINLWVEEKTAGKIQDLIPKGSVDELTRLVLTNAVYLDAKWDEEFDPSDTDTAPFHLAGGGSVSIPMMHQTATFAAVEEDRFLMVHLPYDGYRASMQVYLPLDPADISWLEQTHLTTGPDHWQREMSPHSVVLSLPRFRLEATLTLGRILRNMGMPDAFSGTLADFSGMALPTDLPSDPGFFLSEVIHKTFVDVDEKGTRAAAASGSILSTGAGPSPPRLVVNVDHPFIFTICANSPHYRAPTLLFMGRVMDPTT